MNDIDQLHIHFQPNQLTLLNICLGFLMFGIALDIHKSDFQLLLQNPKPVLITLVAQVILIPSATLLLIYAFSPPPSVALGMIIVSACPGGNTSNFCTHLAKGNTALAVTTTSLSTLLAIVTLPLIFATGASFVPNTENLHQNFSLDPIIMMHIVATIMLAPLLIGMYTAHRFPTFTAKIKKTIKTLSLLIFFAFIVIALIANWSNIIQYLGNAFFIVLILNALALTIGYNFARLNRLSETDARAITFETGVHNTALGLIIIFHFFNGLGGMALIAAWYGIWDLITGFALAKFWSKS